MTRSASPSVVARARGFAQLFRWIASHPVTQGAKSRARVSAKPPQPRTDVEDRQTRVGPGTAWLRCAAFGRSAPRLAFRLPRGK